MTPLSLSLGGGTAQAAEQQEAVTMLINASEFSKRRTKKQRELKTKARYYKEQTWQATDDM